MDNQTGGTEQVLHLPLERIIPNPLQPRRHFGIDQIRGLAQSIKSQGVIQPLIVRPHPDLEGHYQLVAGERRYRAICMLKWPTAPALVKAIKDGDLLEAALVENLQREQLTPIEEALAYRQLLDAHGYTQETLSTRVGKDRSTIANMVRLLALPPALQKDLEENLLSVGHARALLALEAPDQMIHLRNLVLEKALSVRETEKFVGRLRQKNPGLSSSTDQNQSDGSQSDPKLIAVAEALEKHLGTRVVLRPGEEGGKIEIEYYSMDDFNRLYDLILSRD